MDVIVISALGGLLVNALSGIVGNRADAAVTVAWLSILDRLKKGGKPVNQDLQRSVLRSFILALRTICDDCITELKTKKKEHDRDIRWLKQKLRSLDEELKAVEKAEYEQPSLGSLEEIELLVLPDGSLAQDRMDAVRSKLIAAAIRDDEPVMCYKEKVKTQLFALMSLFFSNEIKENQKVRNIFEGQLLAQIDVRLQGQQLTTERIEESLKKVSDTLPKIMKKFEDINAEVVEIRRLIKKESPFKAITSFKHGFIISGGIGRVCNIYHTYKPVNLPFFTDDKMVIAVLEGMIKEVDVLARILNIVPLQISPSDLLKQKDMKSFFFGHIGEQIDSEQPLLLKNFYKVGFQLGCAWASYYYAVLVKSPKILTTVNVTQFLNNARSLLAELHLDFSYLDLFDKSMRELVEETISNFEAYEDFLKRVKIIEERSVNIMEALFKAISGSLKH